MKNRKQLSEKVVNKTMSEKKEAQKIKAAAYREEHREELRERNRQWKRDNKEKVKASAREYYKKNKEKIDKKSKEWRNNNADKIAKYCEENKEKLKAVRIERYDKNKEKEREYQRQWRAKNKGYIKEYNNKRRSNDDLFRMSSNLRSRVGYAFKIKSWSKNFKTMDIIGCSFEEAKEHLSKTMPKGYTWADVGPKVEIDHIIPLSSAKTEEELIKLCHYSNLQLLTKEDNRSKGSR